MKSPAVIHCKCLDTFALQGVARSFGAGAAGVRLTHEGLAAHVRPSRRGRSASERGSRVEEVAARDRESAAGIDELLALPEEPREESRPEDPPPRFERTLRAPRAPARSTLEMGLRKPTTWAVLLLTLGVSFGVVLARVASDAAVLDPPIAAATLNPPRHDSVASARPVRSEPAPSAPLPVAMAPTTIVGRHRHPRHGAVAAKASEPGAADTTPSSLAPHAPQASDTKSIVADRADAPALPSGGPASDDAHADARGGDAKGGDAKGDSDDQTAAATSARAHEELVNAL